MPPIRSFLSTWIILTCVVCYSNCENVGSSFENKTGYNQESRARIFSPRMDYDEWTPLGRGDPLKNDPTFDYVPPVLDRVQYWLDSHTTEPSAKRDILVLGVTAKKTSPKIPEQFLKFVDGPKFTRNQDQYRTEPVLHRTDFTGSSGAEPPKLVRTSNFKNGVIDYRNQNRIQNVPASYYPSPFYGQKPKPYTMMLPPPLIRKPLEQTNFSQKGKVTFGDQQFSTQTEEGPILQLESQIYSLPPKNTYSQPLPAPRPSSKPPKSVVSQIETIKSVYTPPAQNQKPKFDQTTPSVSFEKSNLIYQSTQTLSGGWLASSGPSSSSVSSVSSEPSSQVTWQTPANLRDHFDNMDHHVAASSSHEVVVGQNANIIVDGDSNDNEEVVIGQKEVAPEGPSSTGSVVQPSVTTVQKEENAGEIVMGQPSGSKMHIVMANTPSLEVENQKTKSPIAVVMPTNYMDKLNVTIGDGPKPSPATPNNFGNAMTSEMKQTLLTSNPAPSRNSLPSPPMPPRHEEHHPYLGRPMPPQMAMHQPSMHHTAFPMGLPQQMMQQRPSNSIMQYLPSMPNMMHPMESHIPYRSPSMPHAQPPMTHMHGPPAKPMMRLPAMEELHHQKFSQVPITFTNPPIFQSSTNKHVSRPDNPAQTMMLSQSPILPTVPPQNPETVTPGLEAVTDYIKNESPLAMILNNETRKLHQTPSTATSIVFSSSLPSSSPTPAPSPPPPTTTVPSLTTDPIFSHYKQPAKPIRGPMYLIIQGHSKVKTYKPSVNKHGVPVENNEIQESTTERLSKLEQLINENTKGSGGERVTSKMRIEKPPGQRLGQESLLSLVESGFSAFTVPPPPATEEERETNSVTTIEINN
ncbi:arginine-glutamic acid dipeptide repeats protein [Cephus cinctus]|uniref:Arginine-glutamic acid dipeptide repeats protein n=1 Tax=Cephus cinctus TaxID=211228 RepID=A0AAJ7FP89_CEPCN|nr:arginine-glutamic acid dipeptide repeats protein [Cephus cinctus]